MQNIRRAAVVALLYWVLGDGQQARGQPAGEKTASSASLTIPVEAHFQSTYIWQYKPSFNAAYTGPHSLLTQNERAYTFTATGFFGIKPWTGGELYVDPEAISGAPFSNLYGLGSPTNGEIQKVTGTTLKLYVPRLYARHTFDIGGGTEEVESGIHRLAGTRPRNRIVVTAGKLAITDLFDVNTYSHDPRTQFLTWASLTHGSYDFAADAQGYTWGGAVELYLGSWAARAGRFLGPKESNGPELNYSIGPYHGDQFEIEHRHTLGERAGAIRVLAWTNREIMGRYQDALESARRNGGIPDVGNVRRANRKSGWGVHVEQEFTRWLGGFARYGWADGKTETYSYEEVERSAQVGLQAKGMLWKRPDDTLGVLAIRNGLSRIHRDYLSAGGLGFFIGDGRLRYGPEQIVEAYYNWAVMRYVWLGLDIQRISRPAYNQDRGPVNVYGLRAHFEY